MPYQLTYISRNEKATLVLKREETPFTYSIYLKDDDEDEIEGLRFVLDKNIEFRKSKSNDEEGRSCFLWRDGRFGSNDQVEYEFVWPEEITEATSQLFHLTVAQCLYEALSKSPLDNATEADIKTLMVFEDETEEPQPDELGRIVFKSELAGFYVFDTSKNMFMPKNDTVFACISEPALSKKNTYEYLLTVIDSATGKPIHQQSIDPDATLHTDRASGSFIWNQYSKEGIIWTYSLRFQGAAPLMAFSNAIGQAIYECLNKESFKKVDEKDVKYVLNPFMEDVEMASPEDEEELTEESEDDRDYEEQPARFGKHDEKNTQLAVGYKYDRSFVSRGHSIGVFKHNEDDKLVFSTNIDKIKTSSGKFFSPSKMMLHEEDSSLLLMNPDDRHTVFKMDLDRGSIVEEWKVHPDAPVTDIIPDSKYAQMTQNKTVIGFNDNSLFRIDPRLSGNKRVESEMKQYVVKNKFSAGATTGKGELALASGKGEIRLFDKLDKRAKTLLPGFGDPIIGIDVTENGKLIVATCKNYLLLVDTEISKDVLGFTKSMGSDKPSPKRLQLKPEHVAYMGSSVSFTPARFSTGSSEERAIITSSGPYVITWNLRRVKQGKLYDYQIKRYEDNVVADNFRYGQDRNIVVTLPDHVTMISKKSLSAPTPTALSRSKSKQL